MAVLHPHQTLGTAAIDPYRHQRANCSSGPDMAATKETAAQYSLRELQEVANRLEVVSNRLSAAKRRLQEHFGIPAKESAPSDKCDPISESLESLRGWLARIDDRLQSVASGMEELV